MRRNTTRLLVFQITNIHNQDAGSLFEFHDISKLILMTHVVNS